MPKLKNLSLAVLLSLVTLVFFPTLTYDFTHLDDTSHLDNNPYLDPPTLENLGHLWLTPHLLYMPVTYSVWSLGANLSGKSPTWGMKAPSGIPAGNKFHPFWFHAFTFFFHLTACALVFGCLLSLEIAPLPALFGSLLFALSPVQVEAVAWVSGLKDTLSGTWFFLALFCYLRALKSPANFGRLYLVATVAFVLATLSKPNAVIFPLFALALSVGYWKRPWKNSLLEIAPWLLLSLPVTLVTWELQATSRLQFAAPTFFERVVIAADAIGFYITKLIAPVSLGIDFGRNPETALTDPTRFFYIALAVAATGIVLWKSRKSRFVPLLAILFLIPLLPVLGFKPFSFQTTSTVACRYLYLSLFALALGMASFTRTTNRKVAAGYLVLLSSITVWNSSFWENSEKLFLHSLEVNPRSWLLHNNLASYYERIADWPKTIAHYEASVAIKPQAIALNNLGAAYLYSGEAKRAEETYQRAVRQNPLSPQDWSGLGYAYLAQNKKLLAKQAFEEAAKLSPDVAKGLAPIMQTLAEK